MATVDRAGGGAGVRRRRGHGSGWRARCGRGWRRMLEVEGCGGRCLASSAGSRRGGAVALRVRHGTGLRHTIAVVADEEVRTAPGLDETRGGRLARRSSTIPEGKGGAGGVRGPQRQHPSMSYVTLCGARRWERPGSSWLASPPPSRRSSPPQAALRSARRNAGLAVVLSMGPLENAIREVTLPLRHDDIVAVTWDKDVDAALIASLDHLRGVEVPRPDPRARARAADADPAQDRRLHRP